MNERGVRAVKGYAAFATADVAELAIREDECLVVQLLAGMRRGLLPAPSSTTASQAAKGERAFVLEDGSDIFIAQETWTSFDSMLRIYKMCTQPSP